MGKWGMKTTLELPEELMRRVKLRAVHRNQKLKDAVAQLLEAGLAAAPEAPAKGQPPKAVRLRRRGPLKIQDIESAIAAGRD
jgi:hypothetical protein